MQYATTGQARRVLCINQEDQKIAACGSSYNWNLRLAAILRISMNFYLESRASFLGKMLLNAVNINQANL
jgi:hypothetical protein